MDSDQLETYLQRLKARYSRDNKLEPRKKEVYKLATGIDGKVPEELCCTKCKRVAFQPMYCDKCQDALYCKSCTSNVTKCCSCQASKPSFCAPTKPLLKLLSKILVKCNKVGCQKGDELIPYGDLGSINHMDHCAKFVITCPLTGCGMKMYNDV